MVARTGPDVDGVTGPDKELAPGTNTGKLTETVLRTIASLALATPEQTTPVKYQPGTTSESFTFIVGPAVP
jgi:hypothetical protein